MEPSQAKRPFLHMPSDLLYPLIVLAGFAFFVSLVNLPPNDFWWHLKIGEQIAASGQIPSTNLFSWSIPAETPFTYGAWLGELLLYITYRVGRLELLTFCRNLLITLAYFVVAAEARRASGSWRLAALVTGLAALMTVNNLVIRPQIWAWLPFAAFLFLLNRYAAGELKPGWLLALPLMMIFWVNVHGSFILGGVLVGIYFVGELVRAALAPKTDGWMAKPGWILLSGALCGLAMLVNPRGLGSLSYMLDLLTDKPSQRLIVEWQSPTPEGVANIIFFASILLVLAVVAYARKRLTITELLVLVSFTWLAWSGMRYIVWYSLALMPILARQVAALPLPKLPLSSQTNLLNTILALVIFLPAALVQPWTVNTLPLPQKYWDQVWRDAPDGPLVAVETPVYAVEYLKTHPGGRLFNEMGYGSYLIWAAPEQRVFIDPRVELYALEQWEDYIQIEKGFNLPELLGKYGIDRILLDKKIQPGLAKALAKDPAWTLEYSDRQAELWTHK